MQPQKAAEAGSPSLHWQGTLQQQKVTPAAQTRGVHQSRGHRKAAKRRAILPLQALTLTGADSVLSLRLRTGQGSLLPPLILLQHRTGSSHHHREGRTRTTRENGSVPICRYMIVFLENPKESTKKNLLELIKELSSPRI